MNRNDVQEVIRRYSTIDANYIVWRDEMLHRISKEDTKKRRDHWEATLVSYQRTLESTDVVDVHAVLDEMELYETPTLKTFEYGKIAVVMAMHAKRTRATRREREQQTGTVEDGRRYQCLRCMDRGIVTAWNPLFLVEFRSRYERLSENGFSPGWYNAAYKWWRLEFKGNGPMVGVMRCNCGCRADSLWEEKQQEYAEKKRSRPPACGMAVFDERSCQLVTPRAKRDLEEFYSRGVDDGQEASEAAAF